MLNNSFAILILSCDRYSDMWDPFIDQFNKNMPQGDWRVYLGSNRVACNRVGITPILSGEDNDWSTSYKNILSQIKEQKLFVILEDQLLASKINEEAFNGAINFLFSENAMHIKYAPIPSPDSITQNIKIGLYDKGAPYRATVCGFWDKAYLNELLLAGENPWNFEILGSYRTSYTDGFYCLMSPLCEFKNLIEKGSWIPESVEWANSINVAIDIKKRPMLASSAHWISRFQVQIFKLVMQVSWRKRLNLMNKLRKIFITY